MGLDLGLDLVPGLLGARDPGAAYAQLLINTYGAVEVWRLTDVVDTTIPSQVTSARDGTQSGLTVQNGTSPVTGEILKTPLADGLNDWGDLGTASLISAFNGNEISLFGWARVLNSGVWSDGANRIILRLLTDASNLLVAYKPGSANTFICRRIAGGTTKDVSAAIATTNWFSWAITASVTGDEFKAYLNGSQVGATGTSIGSYSGALANAIILSDVAKPTLVWSGWSAYFAVKFGSPVWSDAQIAAMHAAAG